MNRPLLVLAWLAVGICGAQPTTYNNEKFSYLLRPPTGWNLSENASGVPMFFNYDVSEARAQDNYPDRGAEIIVIPLGVDPRTVHFKTLREWIAFDLSRNHSKISIKDLSGTRAEASVPQGVIEVESDFERENGRHQHEVSYFFLLKGTMFRLTMQHWLGNPNSKELHTIAETALQSIRAK
jgi:hypothetical protein